MRLRRIVFYMQQETKAYSHAHEIMPEKKLCTVTLALLAIAWSTVLAATILLHSPALLTITIATTALCSICMVFLANKDCSGTRMRMQQLLRNFYDLYEYAPCGYLSINRDCLITSVNTKATGWLGFSKDELIGKHLPDFLTQESKDIFHQGIESLTGSRSCKLELTLDCKENRSFPVTLNSLAVEPANTSEIRISILDPVSSKRKDGPSDNGKGGKSSSRAGAEESLNTENFPQISALKSGFLANMCHELRTPLSGVISAAELLSGSKLDGGDKSIVEMLQTSASALLTILNDVLDMSKIESGLITLENIPFSVTDVMQDTTRCLSIAATVKGLILKCHTDPRLPEHVSGDPVRLRQILLNLIGNAVKFTERGHVMVSANLLHIESSHAIVEFTISDTGIGMTEEQQQRLFVPFVQADKSIARRYGGTGLGLAISKQLVEIMGGKLSCRSHKDVGTTFSFIMSFLLPLPEQNAVIDVQPSKDTPSEFRGNVLVVEDSRVLAELTLRQLSRFGVKGESANTGRIAIQATREKEFDLILMDCQLPETDGLEATRYIRQSEKERSAQSGRCKNVPIIAITADTTADNKKKCFDAGMDDFLAKPVTLTQIEEALRKWLPEVKTTAPDPRPEVRLDGPQPDSICWDTDLATGVEELDIDHREILVRLNNLNLACRHGTGNDELVRLFDFLEDYVIYHFNHEEEHMDRLRYPNHAEHKQEHTLFRERLREIRNQLKMDGPNLILFRDANKMLSELLENHIMGMDKRMAQFFLAASCTKASNQTNSNAR